MRKTLQTPAQRRALEDARTHWLAGTADAWADYSRCVRDLEAAAQTRRSAERPRLARRPQRRRRA